MQLQHKIKYQTVLIIFVATSHHSLDTVYWSGWDNVVQLLQWGLTYHLQSDTMGAGFDSV